MDILVSRAFTGCRRPILMHQTSPRSTDWNKAVLWHFCVALTVTKHQIVHPYSHLHVNSIMTKLLHLQGIRGVAICSVIAFHYFPSYFPNGYLGVDLFFVLSGYLMSMMLSRHTTLNLSTVGEFLYRRVKRIVPLYFLIIAASIAAIYVCPCSELTSNMASSKNAIFLITNIQWNTGADYFEKMGVSHDLFTHTWSLCLEMQFYLIFPLLWWLQIRLSPTKRMVFLHIISGVSLYLYFISNSKAAFNSMFCRIWQFIFGNMVFCLENYRQEPPPEYGPLASEENLENDKKEFDSLLFCLEDGSEHSEEYGKPPPVCEGHKEQKTPQKEETLDWIFASLSLVLLIYSTVTEQHLTQNYSRMTTTVVSIILIHFGKNLPVLENAPMVFLGEISYAWYLLHWPMLTLQKIFEHVASSELFLGIFLSFAAAVTVHYLLEKPYLVWSKRTISAVVTALFFAGFVLIQGLDSLSPACQATPVILNNISNMSLAERKEYNALLFQHDEHQLTDPRCTYSKKFGTLPFEGSCKYENSTDANNKTLAIIGNSWAANVSPLIFEECGEFFGNIHRTSMSTCEVLMTGNPWDCAKIEKNYFEAVEQLKPDYLFIIQRYCFMEYIRPEKEWQVIIKEGIKRLELLSTHVKEKIFVLHTFPLAYLNNTRLNNYLDNGTPIEWSTVPWETFPHDTAAAQKKLDQIVGSCTKCEQFDYTPQFLLNGTFLPYDPDKIIPYVTEGLHFTQPGLVKVRPVFTDICNRIGKQ